MAIANMSNANLARTLPSYVKPNSDFTVTYSVSGMGTGMWTLLYVDNRSSGSCTPANAFEFVRRINALQIVIVFWSWFSGSSRLLLTFMLSPFQQTVLFPIDLRYGWDISIVAIQKLILWIDEALRPICTSIEPRCRFWSKSGNTRKPETTQTEREKERPLHNFVCGHVGKIVHSRRHVLVENPQTSALWIASALAKIFSLPRITWFVTHQCRFSNKPDGQRHRKATTLVTTVPLEACIKLCQCLNGHIQLQGVDPETHLLRTASAAAFPAKFCLAIASDIARSHGGSLVLSSSAHLGGLRAELIIPR